MLQQNTHRGPVVPMCIIDVHIHKYIYIHSIYAEYPTTLSTFFSCGSAGQAVWCIATRLSCATSRPTCGLFPYQGWTSLSTWKTWNLHVSWGYQKKSLEDSEWNTGWRHFQHLKDIWGYHWPWAKSKYGFPLFQYTDHHWSLGWSFMGLQVRSTGCPKRGGRIALPTVSFPTKHHGFS